MIYTTLDKIVKGMLAQKRYPIHFYIDFLVYAQRCFEEIHFDTLGNVRTVLLNINSDNNAATLPDDFMDETKVGVANGQFVKPLIHRPGMNRLNNLNAYGIISTMGTIVPGSGYTDGIYTGVVLINGTGNGAIANITVSGGIVTVVLITAYGQNYVAGDTLTANASDIGGTGSGFSIPVATVTNGSIIPYPDTSEDLFDTVHAGFSAGVRFNDHMEFTGRLFGIAVDRADSYKVIKERNEIQFHNDIGVTQAVLEYISDGSEIDNATQVNPYAKHTVEGWIDWQHKENNRSYSEGERMRSKKEFDRRHKVLRGRMNPLTMADIKNAYYRNTLGSPK